MPYLYSGSSAGSSHWTRAGIETSLDAARTSACRHSGCAEVVKLSRIFHEESGEHGGVFVRYGPDPVVRDVAVVRHFVGRIAAAGDDNRVNVGARTVRAADYVAREFFQQRMRERQSDAPVLGSRRARVAVG